MAEVKGTLERKAIEWRQENFAITDLWTDERVADFARDVLEQAAKIAESTHVLHGDHYASFEAPSSDGKAIAAAIRQMRDGNGGASTFAGHWGDRTRSRQNTNAADFIKKLAFERGAIVSSGDCSIMEIAHARAGGRFFIDEDALGYVLRLKEWRELAEKAIERADSR